MDGELWYGCYRLLKQVERRCTPTPKVQFSDARIVEVFLWAVQHDRPISWACQRCHWPPHRRSQKLPSNATMSRRLRTWPVIWMLMLMAAMLREAAESRWVLTADGLPLEVGGCSKDPDTKCGKGSGGLARGYKVVALLEGDIPVAWRLGPMNLSEPKELGKVLDRAAAFWFSGYVVADKAFDTNDLHGVAAGHGFGLRAPRRRPGRGFGHRRHHPERIACITKHEADEPFTAALMKRRPDVERGFAHWRAFPGGLMALPYFGRRPRRVAMWVQGKLILHGVKARNKKRKAA
jgi:hypothetical protein